MKPISRVFVANRGEIAVRIVRTCRRLGIGTVVGASSADRYGLACLMADRFVELGPPRPSASYLNGPALIAAALATGCDALHPGYGFLSESAEFAAQCRHEDLVFVGPTAENIAHMGNKLAAREVAMRCGVPTVPGSAQLDSTDEAAAVAAGIGYPVVLKAAAGGGGRGIKLVATPAELASQFEVATSEAREAFGDGSLYLEKYLGNARHVEIQVLADRSGLTLHLGERDCSAQRRKQKLIEESPCPTLGDSLRERICEAAIALCKEIRYENLGTVEFLWDQDTDDFYFLEMNTRIQVEHPVTEARTGLDLVELGLRIANGSGLGLTQKQVEFRGHAIECRVNAECAEEGFRPSPGRLLEWEFPHMADLRVDTHCYPGWMVAPFYDSLLAKVIARGRNRPEAIGLMRFALGAARIRGVHDTTDFLLAALGHEDFERGAVSTRWVEETLRFGEKT